MTALFTLALGILIGDIMQDKKHPHYAGGLAILLMLFIGLVKLGEWLSTFMIFKILTL